ncbi:hypothetical protein BD779DRAFT_1527695 [Infundibulicybe gibba]|nr:hypothetical protein BD779DRAFT_1527695 [Infundibulicybe gibba]
MFMCKCNVGDSSSVLGYFGFSSVSVSSLFMLGSEFSPQVVQIIEVIAFEIVIVSFNHGENRRRT